MNGLTGSGSRLSLAASLGGGFLGLSGEVERDLRVVVRRMRAAGMRMRRLRRVA